MANKTAKIHPDWIGKFLAGSILGFVIAICISQLFMSLPLKIMLTFKVQIAMWLVAPIWMSILGFCFLFKSGASAWQYLSIISLILYALNKIADSL